MDKRIHYEVGSILVGSHRVGYQLRYQFYQVVGHKKKSRAPQLLILESNIQKGYSTPSQSDQIVTPKLPPNFELEVVIPRWSSKNLWWQLKDDVTFSIYDPTKEYHEYWYG